MAHINIWQKEDQQVASVTLPALNSSLTKEHHAPLICQFADTFIALIKFKTLEDQGTLVNPNEMATRHILVAMREHVVTDGKPHC